MTVTASSAPLRIALVGNPNSGKTALFNQLTGSRQKVANYTGVTVERKEGRLRAPSGREFAVLDLPGAACIRPAWTRRSPVTCAGASTRAKRRRTLLCVIDATNLRLHLRFALELRELGKPMVVALNMVDAAQRRGIQVDVAALERELGVPVVETVAVRKQGPWSSAWTRWCRTWMHRCRARKVASITTPGCARSCQSPCGCRPGPRRSTTHWTAGCCTRCSG